LRNKSEVLLFSLGTNTSQFTSEKIIVWQWTSKSVRSKHSLHPTFTHGSTLGLYELLVGKRCICDIITDSVVHCFCIESEKILSLLGSDPAVEDFLWQV